MPRNNNISYCFFTHTVVRKLHFWAPVAQNGLPQIEWLVETESKSTSDAVSSVCERLKFQDHLLCPLPTLYFKMHMGECDLGL